MENTACVIHNTVRHFLHCGSATPEKANGRTLHHSRLRKRFWFPAWVRGGAYCSSEMDTRALSTPDIKRKLRITPVVPPHFALGVNCSRRGRGSIRERGHAYFDTLYRPRGFYTWKTFSRFRGLRHEAATFDNAICEKLLPQTRTGKPKNPGKVAAIRMPLEGEIAWDRGTLTRPSVAVGSPHPSGRQRASVQRSLVVLEMKIEERTVPVSLRKGMPKHETGPRTLRVDRGAATHRTKKRINAPVLYSASRYLQDEGSAKDTHHTMLLP